ncbi:MULTISPECIES: heavy-metal-associated domain-containing protein [Sphingobacterium]|uniref:Heavy-metal-associated domain-containing protein n=1 Tax=Sphingobacterium populi TaxID=1812824 RepID=A0ABW5UAR3_9SPHI|nr:heavy-metal-associated domain-containing protein [Sphingobacterium sp. CFCC 11742]
MENNVLTFKTSINCGSCIKAVTPFLSEVGGINHWEVDTTNPAKILTVETSGATAEEVLEAVQKAGFTATAL